MIPVRASSAMNVATAAVVTGAVDGLGAEAALMLAQQGFQLVLLNRSRTRTQPLLDRLSNLGGTPKVDVLEVDLASQKRVEEAARQVLERYPRIDLLLNNAGVLLGSLEKSEDGNEMHFQVNTLAPYLLMRLLRPTLSAAKGRVVNVSSGSIHMAGSLKIEELQSPPSLTRLFGAYAQSKLALTALTIGLAEEFAQSGIILRSVDPGANRTRMTSGDGMPGILRRLQPFFFKSPIKGAREIVQSAFGEQFGSRGGVHIAAGKVKRPPPDAYDPSVQRRLIVLCESRTGR